MKQADEVNAFLLTGPKLPSELATHFGIDPEHALKYERDNLLASIRNDRKLGVVQIEPPRSIYYIPDWWKKEGSDINDVDAIRRTLTILLLEGVKMQKLLLTLTELSVKVLKKQDRERAQEEAVKIAGALQHGFIEMNKFIGEQND